MSTSLEMRVRLKLNAKALAWSLNVDWVLDSRLAIWVNVDSWQLHYAIKLVDYADDCVRILSMTKLLGLLKLCKYWNWNWTEIISKKTL